MWLALFTLFLALCNFARGWRSECELEGVDVAVSLHAPPPAKEGGTSQCRVAFFDYNDLEDPGLDLASVDFAFTDSLQHVPFGGRRGQLHFLENLPSFAVPPDLDAVLLQKTSLLSVLLPLPGRWVGGAERLYRQAQALLPDDTYVDDGTLAMHTAAFERYRFSLIAEDLGNRTISLPFVRSLGFHTIPLFNGFTNLGTMVSQAIGDFDAKDINLLAILAVVRDHNDKAGVLWSYHRILQDQLQYRYNRPFEERLFSQACTLCRLRVPAGAGGGGGGAAAAPAPRAFVGIYSAKANFEKRRAVRETWGKALLSRGLRYRFFLGELLAGPWEEDTRVRAELEKHNDIVVLGVDEGYRMNSRKGLLFLEWVALHSRAEFLLKTDDDVYFRPFPLLDQLLERPPAAYAWGFFDYISPVPREEGHPFCNSADEFPFGVFPPYPRGVVRVLSSDVVRRLAEASRRGGLRMVYGDDPCLGVHMRQLIFDPDEPLPSLSLDDRDSYRVFAMEPSCHQKLWSRITNRTWAVHHVSAEQVQCMWDVDVRAGYYVQDEARVRPSTLWPLDALPNLCECASGHAFDERSDMDTLRRHSMRVLSEDSDLGASAS